MALSAEDRRALGEVVEALRQGLGERLAAVVLYGSRARGDARADSDWDLLVIAEDLPRGVMDRQQFFAQALWKHCRIAVSILARTPQGFESHLPSLYLDIALDGQILYDPQEYAARKLATVHQLIGRLGLYRERTEAGDLWRWQQEPTTPWTLAWES
jgi:predicted nucleotidyltransferase